MHARRCPHTRHVNIPVTEILYEDVEPAAILDVRVVSQQGADDSKEYLVRWTDDTDDSWVRCDSA